MAAETPSAAEAPSTLGASSGGDLDLGRATPPSAEDLSGFDENFDAAEKARGGAPAEPPAPVEPAAPDGPAEPAAPALPLADPAAPALPAGPAAPAAAPPAEPPLDPEIAAIPKPKSLSPANESNWAKVTKLADSYKREAVRVPDLEKKIQELEARQPAVPEEVAKELEELRHFRAVVDFENDPTFKSAFDDQIRGSEDTVYSILAKNGFPKERIEEIKQAGGPDKVAGKWWQDNVLSKLDFTDAKRMEKGLVDLVDLREKRGKEISERASKRDEIIRGKDQEVAETFKKDQEVIEQTLQEVTKDVPWARYRDLPAGATVEQKKEVEAHNAQVRLLETSFRDALYPPDAKSRANVAAAAAGAIILHRANTALSAQVAEMQAKHAAEVKKLTDENAALKTGGRVPRPAGSPANAPTKLTDAQRMAMPAEDAVEAGLAEAEGS